MTVKGTGAQICAGCGFHVWFTKNGTLSTPSQGQSADTDKRQAGLDSMGVVNKITLFGRDGDARTWSCVFSLWSLVLKTLTFSHFELFPSVSLMSFFSSSHSCTSDTTRASAIASCLPTA